MWNFKSIIATGTASGLRISSVNGTAFLDNCPADILAAVGAQVKIYDASNRFLLGYVGEVGSSEVLGDELITDWTNNATYPYETFDATGSTINQAVNTTGYGVAYKNLGAAGVNYLKLFKGICSLTLNSGTKPIFASGYNNSVHEWNSQFVVTNGEIKTSYSTSQNINANCFVVRNETGVAADFAMSGISVKQVTAPSSSGVTILNAIGGAQNLVSKDASFTYNAASYTYEISTIVRI
jgi:hypothetical protein